jgi:hypothetical protein
VEGGRVIALPRLSRGRPTQAGRAAYDTDVQAFCSRILEIKSRLDFEVSSRGWCYILEEHGLAKGDFDDAQGLIAECRRQRLLPMDIVAEDGARSFDNLEDIDDTTPEAEAARIAAIVRWRHLYYTPFSFWEDRDVYLEMLVEKIDLKSLFGPICQEFCIPIANARGWSDLNLRWGMLQRLQRWATAGKQCVILYCGDHDPAGLNISTCLRKNLAELLSHSEWLRLMDHLTIDRFGLNYDFIEAQGLTWIDNLETGSGRSLDDPRHKDHNAEYVQGYLRRFGVRKVEANALVVRPDAGRQLCRDAILRYLPREAPDRYREALEPQRELVREEVLRQLRQTYGSAGGEL